MKTVNFEESLDYVNDLLIQKGHLPLSVDEAKDWSIVGGETLALLDEYVNDYLSECHTVKCENKNSWMYQN